jgi:hypothetical protein
LNAAQAPVARFFAGLVLTRPATPVERRDAPRSSDPRRQSHTTGTAPHAHLRGAKKRNIVTSRCRAATLPIALACQAYFDAHRFTREKKRPQPLKLS